MGSEGQQGLASGPRWEHVPHQSDIGVRGIGASPAEAFDFLVGGATRGPGQLEIWKQAR